MEEKQKSLYRLRTAPQLRRNPVFQIGKQWMERRRYKQWLERGGQGGTPNHYKQSMVLEYALQYDLRVLVETGTYYGDMLDATSSWFKELHSIELDPSLARHARLRFKAQPHIHIHEGDSALVLPNLIRGLEEPALFWLDAHYSSGITAKSVLETPIVQELQYIFARTDVAPVILIDDANLFDGTKDYPTLDEVENFVNEQNAVYRMSVSKNIIRLVR